MYEKIMSRFIDRNHLGKEPAPETQGNLYEPLHANTGMRGGWRETRLRADKLNAMLGLATTGLVAVAALGYWYSKQGRQTNHHQSSAGAARDLLRRFGNVPLRR